MIRLSNGCRFPFPRPSLVNTRRLDMAALPLIEEMNRTGLLIDPSVFATVDAELAQEEIRIATDITMAAGRHVNPESGDQVAHLLFDELGLSHAGMRLTPTGDRYSTEGDVLSGLRGQHPLVDMILDHREVTKLRSTYTGPLPLLAGPDGRVRTTLKATTARTGRLASEAPNLQNIPTRGKWGPRIRAGFVARPGCKLVSSDLSQIEMRVAAHESKDANLCKVFWDGLDIHTFTAINLFHLDGPKILDLVARDLLGKLLPWEEKALKEFKFKYRLPAKTLGFATLYGVTGKGLQLQILAAGGPMLSVEECQMYVEDWFKVYPGVLVWMELQYGRARRYEMVWDFFGRQRYVPEVKSVIGRVVGDGLRQAGNHPIQSGAQGIIKTAMYEHLALQDYFRSYGEICDPCLQIHDELIYECGDAIAYDFAAMSQTVMSSCVPLDVPTLASGDVAENWGALK
jgi:DNA polymerase-1